LYFPLLFDEGWPSPVRARPGWWESGKRKNRKQKEKNPPAGGKTGSPDLVPMSASAIGARESGASERLVILFILFLSPRRPGIP